MNRLEWPPYDRERAPLTRYDVILYRQDINADDDEPIKVSASGLTDEEIEWAIAQTEKYIEDAPNNSRLDAHYDRRVLFVLNNEKEARLTS